MLGLIVSLQESTEAGPKGQVSGKPTGATTSLRTLVIYLFITPLFNAITVLLYTAL